MNTTSTAGELSYLAKLVAEDFPNLPPQEPERIAMQINRNGTVWHDGGLPIDEQVRRAVTAWCRHQYTNYDRLIESGMSKVEARQRTQTRLVKTLERWQ